MTSRAVLAAAAVVLAVGSGSAACGDPAEPMVCAGSPSPRTAGPRALFTQCGATADFTPINRYHGDIASVQQREDAVALIHGACTGTLIAAAAGPVVITAGHCVGLGDRELVAFNVEDDPDGDTLYTDGTVIEVAAAPDYALIQLDALPVVTPTQLTTRASDELVVIQHPRGGPKAVAEGHLAGECNDLIYYADLDTLVGSSGAGVLTDQGYLVGVHSDGDCSASGGTNHGSTAAAIVAASAYLQDADIADR